MVGELLHNFNKKFGKFFFGNPNTLYYNIFNKYHKSLIAKKNGIGNEISEFINKGFFKTDIDSSEFCMKVSNCLKRQNIDNKKGYFQFEVDEEIKSHIINHINKDFSKILSEFEKFYNSRVAVAKVVIRRNYHLENTEKEVYSNNYHVDHYTYNHFKLFINLMDVNKNQGPLHIYSKKDTKKFLKINDYKDRSNYKNNELKKDLFVNSGKLGESMFANTTECLHKAGYVEKGFHRDVLFITFITVPDKIDTQENLFYYDKIFPQSIWNSKDGSEILKITKPKSLKKTISLFLKYYKNKIN